MQAHANLDSFAKIDKFSWLQDEKLITFGQIIDFYLPVAVFLGLITLLHVVFEKISLEYEDRKTISDVHLSVLERYFNYQMLNIFVAFTISLVGNIMLHAWINSLFLFVSDQLSTSLCNNEFKNLFIRFGIVYLSSSTILKMF